MELKNIIRNSSFFRSFNLAKSNPNKIGLIVLFDLMFLISFFILQRLFEYFAGNLNAPTTTSSIFIFVFFSLIYYLIILFLYSFFKYSILDFIKSLFSKTKFSFDRLIQFYVLNIVIAGIFFAIMLAFNSLLISIKQNYQPYVFIILAVPYLLFLYIIVNISHSLFYESHSIKSSIKNSFEITFTKIKSYRENILTMILFLLILWLLFFSGGKLINLTASSNYNLYLNAYNYFKQASIIILDLIFYFIILINRISFYAIARENK